MNKQTLERLAKNPHYKPGSKQVIEPEDKKEPMAQFGNFEQHSTDFERHQTEPRVEQINIAKKGKRKNEKK